MPWAEKAPDTLPWSPDALKALKEILKRLEDLDKKLGMENCEDPAKAAWLKAIEDRVLTLEKKAA